jgi:hypothetical protein
MNLGNNRKNCGVIWQVLEDWNGKDFDGQFRNLIFMNIKVEKVLSSSIDLVIWTIANFITFMNLESRSSIDLVIWTIANFITFMNLESRARNNALEECFFQSLDIVLTSNGLVHSPLSIRHHCDLEKKL